MKGDQIESFIIKYIEKKGKLPEDIELNNFDYVLTGYIDSLAMIKFVITLEEKYNIEISDEEVLLPEFRTIGGLASLIKKKITSKGSD